ncbi:hypothetical protein PACILC2_10180 [Paenibacillus cisolokensis]|uniref:DNA polymerase III PolC-type N-terminal domain-containing protein n=1 Tax=Paenibacillus cisolokensis TaxID=1658519 RepID=A0ABQ4N2R1_9BACL|nr:hypothetical protein PACILC2_10180 [Paenibacillus cisolokensis]
MSQTGDKRHRFELLMKQAELPNDLIDAYFADGYIDKVIVSQTNREWTFCIRKTSLVPSPAFVAFCRTVKEKFAHIADVSFVFLYDDEVKPQDIALQYWELFVEYAQREMVSVNGWLARAGLDADGDLLTVTLLDETGLELARKKKSTKRSFVSTSGCSPASTASSWLSVLPVRRRTNGLRSRSRRKNGKRCSKLWRACRRRRRRRTKATSGCRSATRFATSRCR